MTARISSQRSVAVTEESDATPIEESDATEQAMTKRNETGVPMMILDESRRVPWTVIDGIEVAYAGVGEIVRRSDLERAAGSGATPGDPRIAGSEGIFMARQALAGNHAALVEFARLSGIVLPGVSEHGEGREVWLVTHAREIENDRVVNDCCIPAAFQASNRDGFGKTYIDAAELVAWILSSEGKMKLARHGVVVPDPIGWLGEPTTVADRDELQAARGQISAAHDVLDMAGIASRPTLAGRVELLERDRMLAIEQRDRMLAVEEREWSVEDMERGSGADSSDYVDGWNEALDAVRAIAGRESPRTSPASAGSGSGAASPPSPPSPDDAFPVELQPAIGTSRTTRRIDLSTHARDSSGTQIGRVTPDAVKTDGGFDPELVVFLFRLRGDATPQLRITSGNGDDGVEVLRTNTLGEQQWEPWTYRSRAPAMCRIARLLARGIAMGDPDPRWPTYSVNKHGVLTIDLGTIAVSDDEDD